MSTTLKRGATRADGYRFLAYEKRVRRPNWKTLAKTLRGLLAGTIDREKAIAVCRDATEGQVYWREKWCEPKRFKKLNKGKR